MIAGATIDRLRCISVYLRDTGYADHEWFSAALAQYESAARHGLSFDQALGLRLGPGMSPWWEIEDRLKRDTIIRSIFDRYFGGAKRRISALAITVAVERYEAAVWPHHRPFISPPPELVGTLRGDLFDLLKVGQTVSFKVIYAALRVCPERRDLKAQKASYAAEPKRGSRESKESA